MFPELAAVDDEDVHGLHCLSGWVLVAFARGVGRILAVRETDTGCKPLAAGNNQMARGFTLS